MVTKERLEELIQQETTIYIICWGKIKEVSLNDLIYMDIDDDRLCYEITNDKPRTTDLNHLFETKEQAEWYKEFGSIERIEKLGLPTFEEIEKDLKRSSYGIYTIVDDENVMLEYNKHSIKKHRCFYVYDNINGEMEMFNYKDYKLACKKVKEIFLGQSKDS